MIPVKAKKNLGQHFLKDESIARRVAAALDKFALTPLLEIGPGTGMLTKYLLEKFPALKAVELDAESVAYLKKNYPTLEVIEADFLKLNLADLFGESFCVIGNYPYYISSQIFFKVLENKNRVPCCVGMVQKEVAERMTAAPGGKTYGILSVLLQAWYDVEYLFTVSEHAFVPPPKVKSAVVRLTRNKRQRLDCDEKLFKTVVKTAFNRRRKMLRNSIKPLLAEPQMEILRAPIFQKRPEQLSIVEFETLTNMLAPRVEI